MIDLILSKIKFILIIFYLLFNLTFAIKNKEDAPEVTIKYGTLRGFNLKLNSTEGTVKEADIFLGIPYATPPVKNLRFEVNSL